MLASRTDPVERICDLCMRRAQRKGLRMARCMDNQKFRMNENRTYFPRSGLDSYLMNEADNSLAASLAGSDATILYNVIDRNK